MSTQNASSLTANRQIARSTGVVMVALVTSQVVGLIAKSVIGATYGTGLESEAFFAANRFAEILFNLVAGGALASAFIPTFAGLVIQEDQKEAWKLAGAIANLVTLILTIISIFSAVFAPQIVKTVLAPGFSASSPEKEVLTVALLRLQLPSAVIFGLSGLVMGILNVHRHFLLPALAPAMYQLGLIFGALVLSPSLGIFGLGWGVVLGAGLHLLIQTPIFLKLPHREYHLALGLKNPAVREVARLMAPRLLGVAVVQLNFLINTILASFLQEGSLTGINLAFPLMMMPQVAIAQSAAIAALPTFSAQAAKGKLEEMRSSLSATLRGVLLLAIPASIGLILLRVPLVRFIYERSAFTAESTLLVAWPLLWYAAGLVGHSVVEVVSRAFYALHDTRTPVTIGVLAMSLNILLSLLFIRLFARVGWAPHGGLALANSLATFLEGIALLVLMRRRLNGLEGASVLRTSWKAGLAALGMSAAVLVWLSLARGSASSVSVLAGAGLGALVYIVLLLVLRVEEVRLVWLGLWNRLRVGR
ncbi:MAG: murein biosynthesis integral membrane protein MurJ [Anaerolineaceae bacterium]|nr:murein biosynthesis integral membrane protein MurJ [Anaerolineaceae bacterium]